MKCTYAFKYFLHNIPTCTRFLNAAKEWGHSAIVCEPYPEQWHPTHINQDQQVHIGFPEHRGCLWCGQLPRDEPRSVCCTPGLIGVPLAWLPMMGSLDSEATIQCHILNDLVLPIKVALDFSFCKQVAHHWFSQAEQAFTNRLSRKNVCKRCDDFHLRTHVSTFATQISTFISYRQVTRSEKGLCVSTQLRELYVDLVGISYSLSLHVYQVTEPVRMLT